MLSPEEDVVYLRKDGEEIRILKNSGNNNKRVRIQVDNRSFDNNAEYNRYKLTIPQKFLKESGYKRGESLYVMPDYC